MATAGPWTSLTPPLPPPLLSAVVSHLKHPTMTPVQACAIPPLLTHKDVVVDAETGSGKTLSYLVPLAYRLLSTHPSKKVRALVIAPTRELATQVHGVAADLFSVLPNDLQPVALIGGGEEDPSPNADDVRLVVATPGRLWAALSAGVLNVSNLDMLILDEADRLLDMGFAVTLTDILTRLPRQRRTGIYSATQTAELDALARAGMRNPVRVAVKVGGGGEKRRRIPASLRCWYCVVSPRDKLAHLLGLLRKRREDKFIVYLMTCACVEFVRKLPLHEMVKAIGGDKRDFFFLHGKLAQAKRERALKAFAKSGNGVLLCTDVAARGIDIPDVDCVVQMDAPQDPDAYIHRVGRTARLGRGGEAVIYLAPSEDAYVDFLSVRKCPVEKLEGEVQGGDKVREMVMKAVVEDRAVLEAGEAAFLSYLRAYKEHRCRYLLKLEEIDIDGVADFFGLVRMPRFHEFKKLKDKVKPRGEGVCVKDIKFKDKAREKRRQELIKEAVKNRAQRKEALQAKSKKGKKRKRKGKAEQQHMRNDKEAKPAANEAEEEEDDFGAEAWQLRKLKRGKLSHAAFDKTYGIDD